MAEFIVRGEHISLASVGEALDLEMKIALYEAHCSGNNPVVIGVEELKYQSRTLFGDGRLVASECDAIIDANSAYDFADIAGNTRYERDIEIKIKRIFHI